MSRAQSQPVSESVPLSAREVVRSGGRERPILFSAPMVRALLDGTKTQTRRVVKGVDPEEHPCIWGTEDRAGPWGVVFADATGDAVLSRVLAPCPYGVGDLLWVREGFHATDGFTRPVAGEGAHLFGYQVPGRNRRFDVPGIGAVREFEHHLGGWGGRSSRNFPAIHMPRWASRITLRITDVRVERLQDISEADAVAEGLYKSYPDDEDREWFRFHREDEGHTPTPEEWAQFEEGVWMAPGVPQGWGLSSAERRRDQWAPTPQFAYRLIWEHINGPGSWDANPWVWAVSFERIAPLQIATPVGLEREAPRDGQAWDELNPSPSRRA